MAVWSYQPQAVLAETVSVATDVSQVSPASAVTGTATTAVVRAWVLQYTQVETLECASMAAFFLTQRGPFAAFDWVNPNDAVSYRVRFDSEMSLELFQPGLLRLGALRFVSLVSS